MGKTFQTEGPAKAKAQMNERSWRPSRSLGGEESRHLTTTVNSLGDAGPLMLPLWSLAFTPSYE